MLKLNRISVCVACSLLILGAMLCHTYFFRLESIYKFKVALFTYKIGNKATNLLMLFKGTLTLTSEVHSYNTIMVSDLNFYRPRIRDNWGAATFAFAGSKIWEKNSL